MDGGLNTYGYVGGNPLRYTDPLGLFNPIATAEGGALTGTFVCGPLCGIVGGIAGFGLGAWATNEFWIWYNNENADDEGDTCAAQDLPDHTGKAKVDLERELKNRGFEQKKRGSYDEWTAPDGSKIFVRPNGEIIRQGPKRPNPVDPNNSPGIRDRFDQKGNKIPFNPEGNSHSTGEIVN